MADELASSQRWVNAAICRNPPHQRNCPRCLVRQYHVLRRDCNFRPGAVLLGSINGTEATAAGRGSVYPIAQESFGSVSGTVSLICEQEMDCPMSQARCRIFVGLAGCGEWSKLHRSRNCLPCVSGTSKRWDGHRQSEEPNPLTGKLPWSESAVSLLIEHSSISLPG